MLKIVNFKWAPPGLVGMVSRSVFEGDSDSKVRSPKSVLGAKIQHFWWKLREILISIKWPESDILWTRFSRGIRIWNQNCNIWLDGLVTALLMEHSHFGRIQPTPNEIFLYSFWSEFWWDSESKEIFYFPSQLHSVQQNLCCIIYSSSGGSPTLSEPGSSTWIIWGYVHTKLWKRIWNIACGTEPTVHTCVKMHSTHTEWTISCENGAKIS